MAQFESVYNIFLDDLSCAFFGDVLLASEVVSARGAREFSKRVMERIVVTVPQGLNPNAKTVQVMGDSGLFMECPFEIRQIRWAKTDKEKKAARRNYRKEYIKRPRVAAAIKQRLSDPETQRKRKEYANREDVKQRKKELSARKRAIGKLLKEEEEELYRRLNERAAEKLAFHLVPTGEEQ